MLLKDSLDYIMMVIDWGHDFIDHVVVSQRVMNYLKSLDNKDLVFKYDTFHKPYLNVNGVPIFLGDTALGITVFNKMNVVVFYIPDKLIVEEEV